MSDKNNSDFLRLEPLITFGTTENAILLACGESLVDVIAERSVSCGAEVVVRLDVFLNRLATVYVCQLTSQDTHNS